ncbi:helix-turn-helix domain-containing protein [Deinococcus sp. YIM 134068]|uniref:helix-turn-helix domain-containing protein n=1 Tax=Deinococcus lichenicola TaxID=3118910 RepID=UPI002F9414D2
MKPYAQDLRQRVMARLQAGDRVKVVAQRYNVDPRTVERWRERQREEGHVLPRAIPGRPRKLDAALEQHLAEQSDRHPDETLPQHPQRLAQERQVRVSRQTVGRALLRQGRTRKKDLVRQ